MRNVRRTMKRSLAVAVVGSAGLVAAFGAGGSAANAGPEASQVADSTKGLPRNLGTDPMANPASPHRILYDAGLVSDPIPAPPPAVSISQDRALAVALGAGFGTEMQRGTPSVTLRMVAVGSDDVPDPSGAVPSWVLTWTDVSARLHGPATWTTEQRQAYEGQITCVFVMIVDANSGAATG
jgi:hypothetical protein